MCRTVAAAYPPINLPRFVRMAQASACKACASASVRTAATCTLNRQTRAPRFPLLSRSNKSPPPNHLLFWTYYGNHGTAGFDPGSPEIKRVRHRRVPDVRKLRRREERELRGIARSSGLRRLQPLRSSFVSG